MAGFAVGSGRLPRGEKGRVVDGMVAGVSTAVKAWAVGRIVKGLAASVWSVARNRPSPSLAV